MHKKTFGNVYMIVPPREFSFLLKVPHLHHAILHFDVTQKIWTGHVRTYFSFLLLFFLKYHISHVAKSNIFHLLLSCLVMNISGEVLLGYISYRYHMQPDFGLLSGFH